MTHFNVCSCFVITGGCSKKERYLLSLKHNDRVNNPVWLELCCTPVSRPVSESNYCSDYTVPLECYEINICGDELNTDKKNWQNTNTYLSCSLNRFLSNSGKKTSQSNSAMTSVRYTRSHHGCSNATWMQMICKRRPDQTDNTNEMHENFTLLVTYTP